MTSKILKNNRGSLLIESIVSLSITVIGLLGILGLLSRSLTLNRDAGSKLISTYLSAEGIEIIKNLIDRNYVQRLPWNDGLNTGTYEVTHNGDIVSNLGGGNSNQPFLLDSTTGLYGYTVGTPTIFKRTVRILAINNNELKVVSRVDWSTGLGAQSVSLEDHFFDWRSP